MSLQSPRTLAARWLTPLALALALTACAAQGPQLRLETSSAPASGVSSVLPPALVPVTTPAAASPALALGNDGKRLVGAPLDAVLRWHDVGSAIGAALRS